VDGMTLVGVNRLTGRSDWSVGLADVPLSRPSDQVIATDDAAFAASHGLLRRVSLKYGDLQWERFLGSAHDQWRVAACGGLIAAWPIGSPTDSPRHVVWCDAQTGRIVQRVHLPGGERPVQVNGDGRDCLVVTDRGLIVYRGLETSAAAVSSRE